MLLCPSCGERYPEDMLRCPKCNEPLQLPYFKGERKEGKSVWERWRDFFPFPLNMKYSLGEGDTPLIFLTKLSRKMGIEIYGKNETINPTWSFKDRGTFLAINYALRKNFRRVGTVSTGNMGASVAAYAARAGIPSTVFVSSNIPKEKLVPMLVYGAQIIRVDGNYGELYYRVLEMGERGIYFINSDNPYRVEGYKSIAFELYQGDWDYVVIPTSSGGLFRGIYKGFMELKRSGIIDAIPKLVCVQASGCSPIYRAFSMGWEKIKEFENPNTVAHAIANPYSPSGNQVLKILREGHICKAVGDGEIIEAQRELASEGLFVQPASAVTLAAVRKMMDEGEIERGDKVALILTGAGMKYTYGEIKGSVRDCTLENLAICMGKEIL